MSEKIFQKIQKEVQKELSCSAHNMDHILRVYNLSMHLSENENVDIEVIKASALLHDIAKAREHADTTGKIDHAILSAKMSYPILKKLNFSSSKINHIQNCIVSHRYRSGGKPKTTEAKILFDADKLDLTGAIGVVRCFALAGKFGQQLCNFDNHDYANISGKIDGKIKDKSKHTPQIEFETKIKLLMDKLYTEKARKICKERIEFFEKFLKRLEQESKGIL